MTKLATIIGNNILAGFFKRTPQIQTKYRQLVVPMQKTLPGCEGRKIRMINSSLVFQLRDVVVETITKNLLSQLGTEFFLSEFVVFNFQRGYYYLSMIEAYLLLTRAHFRILKAPARKKILSISQFYQSIFFPF